MNQHAGTVWHRDQAWASSERHSFAIEETFDVFGPFNAETKPDATGFDISSARRASSRRGGTVARLSRPDAVNTGSSLLWGGPRSILWDETWPDTLEAANGVCGIGRLRFVTVNGCRSRSASGARVWTVKKASTTAQKILAGLWTGFDPIHAWPPQRARITVAGLVFAGGACAKSGVLWLGTGRRRVLARGDD